jgi:hypothetical protein
MMKNAAAMCVALRQSNSWKEKSLVIHMRAILTNENRNLSDEETRTLRLEVGRSPLLILAREIALDPGDGNRSPDARPQERHDPSNLL